MKYFTINNKTDKEVGNIFPQVDFISTNGLHPKELYNNDENTDNLEFIFEFRKKSKLTDIVSQADIMQGTGLLINEKVKQILEKHSVITHKYIPCKLKEKNEVYQYYWLQLYDNDLVNFIDYPNSVFYWTKFSMKKGELKLSSYEEYLELKKQNGIMWGCEIVDVKLKESIENKYDLFSISKFGNDIYISEKLKIALIKAAITGININSI